MPFTNPINTQEEYDAAIKADLAAATAPFADYDSIKNQLGEAQKQIQGFQTAIAGHQQEVDGLKSQIAEKDTKIKTYETQELRTKAVIENGLPMELRDFLQGDTEDTIKKSAEALAKFAKKDNSVPPMFEPEGENVTDDKKNAYKSILKKLRN